jgi:tetratricopeptide (TPR) repeat protein
VVHALHGLSNVCHFRGDSEAALDYRQQEREVCRGLGDGLSEALAFNSSGMDSVWIGQPEVALTLCRQALAMLEGSNDVWRPRAIGHTLDTVGQAYAALGRYGEAIPAYREALRAVTGLGDRHGEAVVRLHLGQSLRRAGGAEAALANWHQALAAFARLDDPMADNVRAEIGKLSA